jgi:hypothetical protein
VLVHHQVDPDATTDLDVFSETRFDNDIECVLEYWCSYHIEYTVWWLLGGFDLFMALVLFSRTSWAFVSMYKSVLRDAVVSCGVLRTGVIFGLWELRRVHTSLRVDLDRSMSD